MGVRSTLFTVWFVVGTERGTLVQMQLIISLVFSLIRRFSGTWVQSVHSVCSPVQGEQSR
jgi:hypothetical protein